MVVCYHYNMRIGKLSVTANGRTYGDLGKVLNARMQNIDSFTNTIHCLNSIETYDDVPSFVTLDNDWLSTMNIPAKNIVATVDTMLKLNVNKFHGKKKHNIGVLVGNPIDQSLATELKEAGVNSLIPKIYKYGFDTCIEYNLDMVKSGGTWPSFLVKEDSIPVSIIDKSGEIYLTKRQREISYLIQSRGLSNKQIAKHFDISMSTVKLHIGLILKKYGVQSRTQLAVAMNSTVK